MFSELGLSSSEGQANVRFRAASSPPVRRSSSSRDRHTVSLNSVGPERSSVRVNSGWKIVGIFGTFLRGKFPVLLMMEILLRSITSTSHTFTKGSMGPRALRPRIVLAPRGYQPTQIPHLPEKNPE